MSVARITMVDYFSEVDRDTFEVQAKKIFPKDIYFCKYLHFGLIQETIHNKQEKIPSIK